jgi:hypothetical protein
MALAGLEFCIGFILSIFFKNFQKTFDLIENKNKNKLKLNYCY